MSHYSICVIGVYFGKLPAYFNLWLKSCEYNPDIDFLVITDNELNELPKNVKTVKMSLSDIKKRADEVLGFETSLTTPYKCCDFRPTFGLIFKDLISNYDFWGHCDFDVIFGNIRSFITDDILSKYEKILSFGHLSLYKNSNKVNEYFKLNGSKCGNFIDIYKNPENVAFDEKNGIGSIYKVNNLPIFDKIVFLDIYSIFTRFKAAHGTPRHIHQSFYWQNGRILTSYVHFRKVYTQEFAYIHFKKRKFDSSLDNSTNAYYISENGFTQKHNLNVPSLSEIKDSNPFVFYTEIKDYFIHSVNYIKKKFKGLKHRIKAII